LYDDFCVNCHGAGAVGGGVVPDLRYSGFLLNTEGWQQVVREGALANRGMVSFADEISQDGAEAIRNYIMDRNQYAHSIGDTQRISR
jgi:mono/diheme cytochrome c family protein